MENVYGNVAASYKNRFVFCLSLDMLTKFLEDVSFLLLQEGRV